MTLQDFRAPDSRSSTSVQLRGCSCPVCKLMEKTAPGEIDLGIVDTIPGGPSSTQVVTPGTPFVGYISPATDTDVVRLNAVAGQTYMITLRGTGPTPIDDPFLELINPTFTAFVAYDDDGGAGVTSLINFTATANATYFIRASSFTNPGQAPEPGQYQIDVRLVPTVDTVSANPHISNPTLTVGETFFAFAETSGDADMFQVHLEAGKVYSFETAGGYDYLTVGTTGFPAGREIDTRLALFDPNGNFVAFNDDINGSDWSSGTSYFATETGTYFLRVFPYAGSIGGYTVDVKEMEIDLTANPLDAIDWGTQLSVDTVKVYFAAAGESFGGSGVSLGWTAYEVGQAMEAFELYEQYIDLEFEITTNASEATFKMVSVENVGYLGRFGPPETGAFAGVGEFAVDDATWDRDGSVGSLEPGGYGFVTLLHEIGHGLGLAHPHDNGGGSPIMEGVFGAFFSYGMFNLNQGIYTMMSYNAGWHTQPGVPFGQPPSQDTFTYGAEGTPGPLDVALLQLKYGPRTDTNAGDTVYILPTANVNGTAFKTIWDTSGVDTIRHDGTVGALIDLTAATLDYSPTGGGVVSFVDGVYGGFTIAHNTVIENAVGGSGDDGLIGNAAANRLSGNGGQDVLIGRAGNDRLEGGDGDDDLDGGDGHDVMDGGLGADAMAGGDGNDLYMVESAGDSVTESENEGRDRVIASLSWVLGANVEDLELVGTAANGTGNALDNLIIANNVANIIDGGAGIDTVSYEMSNAGVLIRLDDVRPSPGTWWDGLGSFIDNLIPDGVGGYAKGDTLRNIENVTGSAHNDQLLGNNIDNVLSGGGGYDLLYGEGGNDTLNGGTGKDLLYGGDGNDQLNGGSDNDQLNGGNGNDVLNGGAGDDQLNGDGGVDRFVFADRGTDTIFDYKRGEKIDLTAFEDATVTFQRGKILVDFDGIAGTDLTIILKGDNYAQADVLLA